MDDFSHPRTRVNGSMLAGHRGRNVCLLGTVQNVEANGMKFKLSASDGQIVSIKLAEPMEQNIEGLIEVHGQVGESNEILCKGYVLFPSPNFDMETYDTAVQLMAKCPGPFTAKPESNDDMML